MRPGKKSPESLRSPLQGRVLSSGGPKAWREGFGFAFFLLSLLVLLRYIWGPSAAFIHSDSTDTILWAQASLQAGRSLDPAFHYAGLLPFGANLWYIPMLAAAGLSVKVQLWGLTIFLLLFAASIYFFFRALPLSRGQAAAASAVSLLFFSGSDKLREIFWGHVIYYSLGLFFLALGLGLIFRIRQKEAKQCIPCYLLLSLLCVGAGTDGVQMAAVFFLPLAAGLVLELLLSEDRAEFLRLRDKNVVLLISLTGGTAIGFIVLSVMRRGGVRAGYADAYSSWSNSAEWTEHFLKIIPDFFNLTGASVHNEYIHMVSPRSFGLMLLIFSALLILFLPLAGLFFYRKIRNQNTKLLLLVHTVNAGIILFLYIFGKLGAANWRLIPLLGSGLWAAIALCFELLRTPSARELRGDAARRLKPRERPAFRAGFLLLLVLGLTALVNVFHVLTIRPEDAPNYEQRQTDLAFMEEHDLNYGFATFWNANVYTLLSDEEVRVRDITADEKGIKMRPYQNRDSWFEKQDGIAHYFLLLTDKEFGELRQSPEWPELEAILLSEARAGRHNFLIFDEALLPHLQS